MVKCPGVIGWKANAPTPGMESAGKCPTIARGGGGMGTAGIDWCIKQKKQKTENKTTPNKT